MVANEVKEQMASRKRSLRQAERKEEKRHVFGRWVTDENALRRTEVARQERHIRLVPKRVASMGLMGVEASNRRGLETEPGSGEVTDRVTQNDIVRVVDEQTAKKRFELRLTELGPYTIDYTQNGAHLALLGLRGHLATVQWSSCKLLGETQLKDKCTDIAFLVDHSMVAVAQKRFVYMYTKEGAEIHILSKMANMDRLQFLNRHQLLCATSSTYSTMTYLDVSTGKEVGLKPPAVMREPTVCLRVNPSNAVVATCDTRGVVKFWSPSIVDPLVQLKAHSGAVQDIAFHANGRYMVTVGAGDRKMKVWDCRMLRTLEEYPVTYTFTTVDISANGLVAIGGGTRVEVWNHMFSSTKQNTPYLKHGLGYGNIANRVRFCPFEDVLGIGHSNGFSTMLVPGAGEANPDFYHANPYETDRHRQERVVQTLLDKLPPDTIGLDLKVGDVDEKKLQEYAANLAANRKAKRIREKKQRRADTSKGDAAPSGLISATGNIADDVDEELGVKEKGAAKVWLSKKEKQQERKKARWDKKDSADKVRSKQTMRHSRIVQRERHLRQLEDVEDQPEAGPAAEAEAPPAKRRRVEERSAGRSAALERWSSSDALRRFA